MRNNIKHFRHKSKQDYSMEISSSFFSTTNKFLLNDLEHHEFSRSYWNPCTRMQFSSRRFGVCARKFSKTKLTTTSGSDIFSQSSVQCQQELRLSIIGIECIAFPYLKRHLKLKVEHGKKIWSVDKPPSDVRIKSSCLILVSSGEFKTNRAVCTVSSLKFNRKKLKSRRKIS